MLFIYVYVIDMQFVFLYSESITALRLEDIVMSPRETVSRLLQFLNFPTNPLLDDFVKKQCTTKNQDRALGGRNYDRSKLSWDDIQKIQITCKHIFGSLGYSFLDLGDEYYSTEKLSIFSRYQNETWTL